MITTAKEYFDYLAEIESSNPPSLALLPTQEKIYSIDLDSRLVEAPEYLSVEKDHKAETIYFKIDRFFDYMDLTETTCVIHYVNGDGQAAIYPVPFYDVVTCSNEEKMLFPWCIDGMATQAAGPVEFQIRFYKLNNSKNKYAYNFNTLPATSKVMYGMDIENLQPSDYDLAPTVYDKVMEEIRKLGERDIYWEDLD